MLKRSFRRILKPKFILGGSAVYFIYHQYYRKVKGLSKMEKNFANELIVKSDQNRFDKYTNMLIANNYENQPIMQIYPQTVLECRALVRLATKYNLKLITDQQYHEQSESTFKDCLVVNMSLMKNCEVDCQNMTVQADVGLTIQELNTQLLEKGYQINVDPKFRNKQLFEILNRNDVCVNVINQNSFTQLVNKMTVIGNNGDIFYTSNRNDTIFGINAVLNEYISGKNSINGIICDVNLKIQPVDNRLFNYRCPIKQVQEVEQVYKHLRQETSKINRLQFVQNDSNEMYLDVLATSQLDQQLAGVEYSYQELNRTQNVDSLLQNGDTSTKYLQIQSDLDNFQDNYERIREIVKEQCQSIEFDIKNNNMFVNFYENRLQQMEKEKERRMVLDVINLLQYKDGVLVNYTADSRLLTEMKKMSIGVEVGYYGLQYFNQMNRILNKNRVNASVDYSSSYIE